MNLRHLRLSDCVFYNRNPAPLFADPAAFPTLEHLTLTQHRFNHISEHAVSQLLNSLPPRLQSLNFGRAPFQAEGIREWLQIPQSRQLSGGIRFWLSQSQLEILDAIVRNLGSWRVDCAPDPAQGFGVWLRPAD